MATETKNDVEDIRRRMAQIRHELHEDMQNVVAGAEAVTDWRRYFRLYPWAGVGLAAAAGYFLVPRRRRTVVEKVTTVVPTTTATPKATLTEKKKEKRAGLTGLVFGALGPIALRAAQSYAMSFIEQWITQQQHAAAGQSRPDGPPGFLGMFAPGPPAPGSTGRTTGGPGPPPKGRPGGGPDQPWRG